MCVGGGGDSAEYTFFREKGPLGVYCLYMIRSVLITVSWPCLSCVPQTVESLTPDLYHHPDRFQCRNTIDAIVILYSNED